MRLPRPIAAVFLQFGVFHAAAQQPIKLPPIAPLPLAPLPAPAPIPLPKLVPIEPFAPVLPGGGIGGPVHESGWISSRDPHLETLPWFQAAQKQLQARIDQVQQWRQEAEAAWGGKTQGILQQRFKAALAEKGVGEAELQKSLVARDFESEARTLNAIYEKIYDDALEHLKKVRLAERAVAAAHASQINNLLSSGIIPGAPAPEPLGAPAFAPAAGGGTATLMEQAVAKSLPLDQEAVAAELQAVDNYLALVQHDHALMDSVLAGKVQALIRFEASSVAGQVISDRPGPASAEAGRNAAAESEVFRRYGLVDPPWFSLGVALHGYDEARNHEAVCVSAKVPLIEALSRLEAHIQTLDRLADDFARSRLAARGLKVRNSFWPLPDVRGFYDREEARLAAWMRYVRAYHEYGPLPADLAAVDNAMADLQDQIKAIAASIEKLAAREKENAALAAQIEAAENQAEAAGRQSSALANAGNKAGAAAADRMSDAASAKGRQLRGSLDELNKMYDKESRAFFDATATLAVLPEPPKGRVVYIAVRSRPRDRDDRGFADYIFQWNRNEIVAGVPAEVLLFFDSTEHEQEMPVALSVAGASLKLTARAGHSGSNWTLVSEPFFPVSLAAPSPTPAQPPTRDHVRAEEDSSPLAGLWKVAYTDRALGDVTGTARINGDASEVSMTLTDPKTGTEHQLISSRVSEKNGVLEMVMVGASPAAATLPPFENERDPDPVTFATLTLPRAESKLIINVGDLTGEKPVAAQADAQQNQLVLRMKMPAPISPAALPAFDLDQLPPGIRDRLKKTANEPPPPPSRLDGWWTFQADTMTWRDAAGRGRIGSFRRDWRNPNQCWQFGRETWIRTAPPRVLLFAKTAGAPKLLNKVYLDIPMYAEVLFEAPSSMPEYPLELIAGGRPLKLIAKPLEEDRRVYRSEVFLPWRK